MIPPVRPIGLGGIPDGRRESLQAACQEFESLFLEILLREMRAGLSTGGLTSAGPGGRIFDSLWVQEVARSAARSGPLGIAAMLEGRLGGSSHIQAAGRLKLTPQPTELPSEGS